MGCLANLAAVPAIAVASALLFAGTSLALASTSPTAAVCGQEEVPIDPLALYGPQMRFEVRRNGEPVGEHTVAFSRRGDTLVAESQFTVTVKMLGIAVYQYTYASTDVWKDGCLVASRSEIDDDGERTIIEAEREGSTLLVRGPAGTASAAPTIIPTNHWNASVLGHRQVLNTLTGSIDDVIIVERGIASKPVNGVVRPVRHYAYTGDLHTEVWYDDAGRWVALRFEGRDGSAIEFVCQRCASDLSVRR